MNHKNSKFDKGQVIQIGFILLISVLFISLALYQSQVIPIQNREVEIEHTEKIQKDMQELRNSIISSSFNGGENPVSLSLGTNYPLRLITINPPNPRGSIYTLSPSNISIMEAKAITPETNDYWNGKQKNFSTKTIVYKPDYNRHQAAPETIYENTILYNNFLTQQYPITNQRLINGKEINIITLTGTKYLSGPKTTTIDIKPVSQSERKVVIKNETKNPINISIPTRIDNKTWKTLLKPQYKTNNGHIINQQYTKQQGNNKLTLTLEKNVSYNLKMSKVNIADQNIDKKQHYIIPTKGNNTDVIGGSTQKITAEVRDKYNNPVSGVKVNATIKQGSGSIKPKNKTTNNQGRTTFQYQPTKIEPTQIEVNITKNPTQLENATFHINHNTDTTKPKIDYIKVNSNSICVKHLVETSVFQVLPGEVVEDVTCTENAYSVDVNYSVSDMGFSGLDYIFMRINHTNSNIGDIYNVTATTHKFNGESSFKGRWITPYIKEGKLDGENIDNYNLDIRVVDTAGNTNVTTKNIP